MDLADDQWKACEPLGIRRSELGVLPTTAADYCRGAVARCSSAEMFKEEGSHQPIGLG